MNEELFEARREHESTPKDATASADTARLLATVEAKYEGKLTEMKRVLNTIEKERNESDAEWSRKLREKNKETERLNRMLGTATQSKAQEEGVAEDLKMEISRLQKLIQAGQSEISSLHAQIAQVKENEVSVPFQSSLGFAISVHHQKSIAAREAETETKIRVLEQKMEEGKSRESQLRAGNKVKTCTQFTTTSLTTPSRLYVKNYARFNLQPHCWIVNGILELGIGPLEAIQLLHHRILLSLHLRLRLLMADRRWTRQVGTKMKRKST